MENMQQKMHYGFNQTVYHNTEKNTTTHTVMFGSCTPHSNDFVCKGSLKLTMFEKISPEFKGFHFFRCSFCLPQWHLRPQSPGGADKGVFVENKEMMVRLSKENRLIHVTPIFLSCLKPSKFNRNCFNPYLPILFETLQIQQELF